MTLPNDTYRRDIHEAIWRYKDIALKEDKKKLIQMLQQEIKNIRMEMK